MVIKLELYENPRLESKVKPGQIIEALPGAIATQTIFYGNPICRFPTNVFGYARGILKRTPSGSWTETTGDTLVERLYPFEEPHICENSSVNKNIKTWSSDRNVSTYLVIGELANVGESNYEDEFSQHLIKGSMTLSLDQKERIRDELFSLVVERKQGGDYVFESPEGKIYSLNEIILSLRKK